MKNKPVSLEDLSDGLQNFLLLAKGMQLKDKKTTHKIMQLENDVISLMEKQLELEEFIRSGQMPKRGLGLFRRLLHRFGTPQYTKKELKAVHDAMPDSQEVKL